MVNVVATATPASLAIQRLEAAWLQLAGTAVNFVEDSQFDAALSDGYYALTPIHVPKARTTGGIALNLPTELANQLAATLFNEAESSVDESMRVDISAELSNILCACVTSLFGPAEEIELGVTMAATRADLVNVFRHNEVRCVYRAETEMGDLHLVVVDSFALRQATPIEPHADPVPVMTMTEEKASMKFLIVDDSRAIQTIVRRAVEKTGLHDLEFKTASNGTEAIKTCESWLPDMVITDWHMPGMTGIELIKALKQKHAGLRVGFVTTESSSKNLDEAKQNGAAFVIRKPFADEELVNAVLLALETPALDPGSVRGGTLDSLAGFLSQSTGTEIGLSVTAPCSLPVIQVPWAIGLYAQSHKNDVRGFCLLDRNAILLLGGPCAGMSREALVTNLNGGDIAPAVFTKASELLDQGAGIMFISGDGLPIVLSRSQLVPQPPEKLIEIMNKSPQRIDYSITHSNLPLGRIVVISR